MSQTAALAPSATNLATSAITADDYQYDVAVRKIAEQKLGKNASGRAIEKLSLNREKLIKSALAEWRREYPQLLVNPDERGIARDIPKQYFEKIVEACHKFCDGQISGILNPAEKWENHRKVINWKPNFKDNRIDEELRVTATRVTDLDRQITHCDVHIDYLEGELRRRVELNSKPGNREPNYEKENILKKRIEKWVVLREVIKAKIASVKHAVRES